MPHRLTSPELFAKYHGYAIEALLRGPHGESYMDNDFPDALADDGVRLARAMYKRRKK